MISQVPLRISIATPSEIRSLRSDSSVCTALHDAFPKPRIFIRENAFRSYVCPCTESCDPVSTRRERMTASVSIALYAASAMESASARSAFVFSCAVFVIHVFIIVLRHCEQREAIQGVERFGY